MFQKVFATVDKASFADGEEENLHRPTATAAFSRRTILRMAESAFGAGTKTVRGFDKGYLSRRYSIGPRTRSINAVLELS